MRRCVAGLGEAAVYWPKQMAVRKKLDTASRAFANNKSHIPFAEGEVHLTERKKRKEEQDTALATIVTNRSHIAFAEE